MWLTAHASVVHGRDELATPAPIGRHLWRRADPLSRLALHAVARLEQAQWLPDTALVVATSFGAVTTTRRFVDSIATYGDAQASPAAFSGSVHNACADALSQALQIHGPVTTITHGPTGLSAALQWAHSMLQAQRCQRVLAVLGECHDAWSEQVVGELADLPWPIGSGCTALLLDSSGPGRLVTTQLGSAEIVIDAGGGQRNEVALSELAGDLPRHRAADDLGCWWPSCALAVLDRYPQALVINEYGADGNQRWGIGADTDPIS